ncbi:hypothetical protein K525DRAFT_267141 [Schizophyllum commune Loenen D]|nr:hypothetical protein K525DRAFT_267141 [Schizophyllum commune Loenen D]
MFSSVSKTVNVDVEKHPTGSELDQDLFSGADNDTVYGRKCAVGMWPASPVVGKANAFYKSITEEVGFGRYQIELFLLTGMGWMADNIWLQGVAVVLTQVQQELNPSRVEFATLALYVGLILGASVWGTLADVIGYRAEAVVTLLIAGVFGIAAGAAPIFVTFAALVACIGFGVGENVPVDGVLFLEHIPQSHQRTSTRYQHQHDDYALGLIGLAYPLFNPFLPLYLADRVSDSDSSTDTIYRNYTIISVLGIVGPGSAYLFVDWTRSSANIDSDAQHANSEPKRSTRKFTLVGRKLVMALSTVLTGVFLFLFRRRARLLVRIGAHGECDVRGTVCIYAGGLPRATPGHGRRSVLGVQSHCGHFGAGHQDHHDV